MDSHAERGNEERIHDEEEDFAIPATKLILQDQRQAFTIRV
jgi:hypothetical protein